jgi:hypothetical protein
MALAFSTTTVTARAETTALRIEHKPMPCALASLYPEIEARIEPADDVEAAHVVFHAEDAALWYSVEMQRGRDTWTAALPRPQREAVRFAYYIAARGKTSQGRAPAKSAFIVDVSATCPEGALPGATHGPAELGVPPGAPRVPAGFDAEGISRFVESLALEAAPGARESRVRPAFSAPPPVPLLSRVRLATVAPPAAPIGVIRQDERSITTATEQEGKAVTLTRAGHKLEGQLESYDADGALLLQLPKAGRVRVRMEDLVSLEVRQSGSTGGTIVGTLAGASAGMLVSVLVCVTVTECGSAVPLWIGTLAGAGLGASAGAPSWKPVVLAERHALALTLEPRRAGAALGVRFAF